MVVGLAGRVNMREEHSELLHAAFGDEFHVERLSGGVHGRGYRVTGAGFDYAVRMPAPDEGEYRIGCRTEQRVLARVAAAGLAPPVAATALELGLIVTKFMVDARTWTIADAQQPVNIDRLAARLRTLHALDLDLEPYACVDAAESYVGSAAERRGLSPEQRRWGEELLRLATDFEARFRGSTSCHNDLVASNVLDDGELWLVDFEYAAASSPILDLAGFAALNDFDAERRARLVFAYYGDTNVPIDAADLDAAVRMIRLLALFWALAAQTSADAQASMSAFADAMVAVLR